MSGALCPPVGFYMHWNIAYWRAALSTSHGVKNGSETTKTDIILPRVAM